VDAAEFRAAEESPEHLNFSPEWLGGGSVRMVMIVEDPDAAFDKAIAAGAAVVTRVDNHFGWRLGRLVDPFGHHWKSASRSNAESRFYSTAKTQTAPPSGTSGNSPGKSRLSVPSMPRESPPHPACTARYCLPSIRKVVGGARIPEFVGNSHSSFPLVASNA
jgi:hypothetical protein